MAAFLDGAVAYWPDILQQEPRPGAPSALCCAHHPSSASGAEYVRAFAFGWTPATAAAASNVSPLPLFARRGRVVPPLRPGGHHRLRRGRQHARRRRCAPRVPPH